MNYSFKTISKKVMGDLHTPVSIYLKVRDIYPESALLESSDFHGNENSLSFIALRPLASIGINNGECTATFPDETREVTPLTEDYNVPEAMNAFLGRFKVEGADKKVCGLFGYTAFDAVRYFENIPVMEVHHEENDAPDMLYILYKYILVFNHFKNELTLVEMLQEDEASRLEEIETLIENRNFASYNFQTAGPETSPITGEEYKAMVRQGIKHCLRGDVFQIVLSRRFEQPFKGDDFKVYRALRSINPSPYLFYFDFGGFRIFGSSPETHCKVTGRHASIDPIAGTAFRTGNIEVDKQRTEALLADPKENAEHVMLVDLARNDLSRNAHDVQVDFYKEVQYYSHVIHLVSRVSGEINADSDPVKTYVDTFPAGTLSGAPKVRAMQLIDQIESHARGIYGGCIGYIGFEQTWTDKLTDNAPHLQFFDMSQGVDLIYDNTHVHHHAANEKEHQHAIGVEPHIWNSAVNAQIIAGNILSALRNIDKGNEDFYLERYNTLCRKIEHTDSLIRQTLATPGADHAFMIYHPALSYFARDYGLHQIPIEAGGKEPSPAHLKALIDTCSSENVHVIFVQPEFDRRNAELIAQQTGTRVVDINPLSYDWETEMLNIAQALNPMKNQE